MAVITKTLRVKTKGEDDIVNISEQTSKAVENSGIKNGTVTIFVSGSTAALTTIEYEPGLLSDLPKMLERIAPKNIDYGHEQMWHDGNGHSHVRASLVGPSLTVPFSNGNLMLGTWQQIVLLELDTRSRERDLILQMVGE
ncbi:MAG TPA: secondary thiamine-phosphate synthase enzyme YjbQ [Nitrosopumilaceae archaeon]